MRIGLYSMNIVKASSVPDFKYLPGRRNTPRFPVLLPPPDTQGCLSRSYEGTNVLSVILGLSGHLSVHDDLWGQISYQDTGRMLYIAFFHS